MIIIINHLNLISADHVQMVIHWDMSNLLVETTPKKTDHFLPHPEATNCQ